MAKSVDSRAGYIAIATHSFAAHGFHGVSLARLAREAGVTKQALLHFFGTKERLYGDVLTALAARLCKDIDAAARPDPSEHLLAYFQNFRAASLSEPDDVRLVVRALLDSDPAARKWPLKPYLDTIIALARRTTGGRDKSQADILAWLSQIIGMVQYVAISAPATAGMYGGDVAAGVADQFEQFVEDVVSGFTTSAGASG
ncbi:MAG: TetR/AcrR family transcriptional regulator [Arenibacterium sp.]